MKNSDDWSMNWQTKTALKKKILNPAAVAEKD